MTIGLPETKRLTKVEGRYLAVAACVLFVCFELAIGASLPFAALMGVFLALTLATIQTLGGIATIWFGAARGNRTSKRGRRR